MKYLLKKGVFFWWMGKTELDDRILLDAVDEMESGLIDADLGGVVYKKRIAQLGRGKRGSTRTLIATNRQERWIFLTGFEKNERSSITRKELCTWKMITQDLIACTDEALEILHNQGELEKISYE